MSSHNVPLRVRYLSPEMAPALSLLCVKLNKAAPDNTLKFPQQSKILSLFAWECMN